MVVLRLRHINLALDLDARLLTGRSSCSIAGNIVIMSAAGILFTVGVEHLKHSIRSSRFAADGRLSTSTYDGAQQDSVATF